MIKRKLVLEDGTIFEGVGFGSERSETGEVIFNTAMTGYQEIISNPSNYGSMIVMTSPAIGVYGINRDDFEAVAPAISGLITKEHCTNPTNFRSDMTLDEYLREYDVPGISGIDTRMLTKHIRTYGILKGKIINSNESIEDALKSMNGEDDQANKVKFVSTKQPYSVPGRKERIVVIDLGMKHGILRELTKRNCQVTIVPYSFSVDEILRLKPNGIILSNGPGSPNSIQETVKTVQELKHLPLFGIGLGHQVIGLAFGGNVSKMKFGHHGNNYPVQDIRADKAYITTQNHHYTVSPESIEDTDFQITFKSIGENDVAGLRHKKHPIISVQFYPDGGPGPDDMTYLYEEYLQLIKDHQASAKEDLHAKKY